MPSAYHMVHYRRFDASNFDLKGNTLESLCRVALNTPHNGTPLWERPGDRICDTGDKESRKMFLNKVADLSSAVFGEICLAQSGDLQAILQMHPSKIQLSELTTAVVYELEERQAPAGSQFIRGLAYWIGIGNHILFVKTQTMTADLIHQYLDWLLKVGTSTAPQSLSFSLHAELDQTGAAADIGEIQSLRVTGKSALN